MKYIIVVEGKSDTRRLKQIDPSIQTFETSGLGLDEVKMNQLKELSKTYKLVVFTDPDGPGEIIRTRITNEIKDISHAYLTNHKAVSKNKKFVGIEHGSDTDIIKALANVYQKSVNVMNYEISDLVDIGIYNDRELRNKFCNELNIAYGNNKKVLKQLNDFAIEPKKIEEALRRINGTS